jgi:hypothetical protein
MEARLEGHTRITDLDSMMMEETRGQGIKEASCGGGQGPEGAVAP